MRWRIPNNWKICHFISLWDSKNICGRKSINYCTILWGKKCTKMWLNYASHYEETGLQNLLCRNTRGTHRPSFLLTVSLSTYSFTRVSNPACWNKPAKYSVRRTNERKKKQYINFNAVIQMIKNKQFYTDLLRRKRNGSHPVLHRNSPPAYCLT